MNLLNIPIGTRVLFYDDDEKEVYNFEVTADKQKHKIPTSTSKIGFMFLHISYGYLRIGEKEVKQPIIFSADINVADLFIPDPIFDNKPIDAQGKFPFLWMKNKLETIFNDKNGDSLDGAYTRTMMLSSVLEASLREILDEHPTDNKFQICTNCNKDLKDLNAMIDHLTSSNCDLLESICNPSFIIDKEKIKACLHTIRVARNKLVHRLDITTDNMNEIEKYFEPFKDNIPFGNRWLKLSQISTYSYCYLQKIVHMAYSRRANQLTAMHIIDYFSDYIDDKLELVNCSVYFE